MAVVVVGGHSRKTGKTSVVASIIKAFSQYSWTAVKITSHWHSDSPATQPFIIQEERDSSGQSDTSRFLAAGASRALWVRVQEGYFESAMQKLLPIIRSSPFAIIESNRILKHIRPDLFVFVLRYDVADFKDSAREIIQQAHAIVAVNCGSAPPPWNEISQETLDRIPMFVSADPAAIPASLVDFLRSRLVPAAGGAAQD